MDVREELTKKTPNMEKLTKSRLAKIAEYMLSKKQNIVFFLKAWHITINHTYFGIKKWDTSLILFLVHYDWFCQFTLSFRPPSIQWGSAVSSLFFSFYDWQPHPSTSVLIFKKHQLHLNIMESPVLSILSLSKGNQSSSNNREDGG